MTTAKVPVYCYQCVAGPDLLKVVVRDGVAVGVEPNADVADTHPACGKVCVRAYGLVQKLYNPHRVRTPLRRTNPRKGRGEDPGWAPVGWDEALDLLARKLGGIRERGLVDEAGYPRLAVTFGSGGIAPAYLGTFAAFLAAWGPVDQGIGSGQGVKCYHSEHLYGEFWHRAFTVAADTPSPVVWVTVCDPTGWAVSTYCSTTARRIAALRSSRSVIAPSKSSCGSCPSSGELALNRTECQHRSRPPARAGPSRRTRAAGPAG